MLHYDLHARERKARDHIEEEQQRLQELKELKHIKHQQQLIQQQHGTSFSTRKVTAASSKYTWQADCRLGRKDAVIKGLAHGFFLANVRDHHDQKTPLIIASRWGETPLVRALLLRKADVMAQDMHGNSSLSFACQYGHLEIVRMLLGVKLGGKEMIHVCNKVNLSPLHRAAIYNHREVINLLLQEGASSDSKDNAHRTPLDYARLYKHPEATSMLEQWETMLSAVVKGGK